MNKDGFTLVELLAVIVILGIITLVVTISTNRTINNSKTKLSKIQIQKIEEAAKLYYLSEGLNNTLYDLDESKTCVNVSYLTENDYLENSEIKNLEDDSTILGSVKIIYKSKKYSYEYQDTKCNHSDYFVSADIVCDLVSGSANEIGSKYQCKVKEKMQTGFENGYYFYVLSYNDKNGNIIKNKEEAATMNLIMDRNVCDDGTVATSSKKCTLAWYSSADVVEDDNSNGPITAMSYLHRATRDWTNVPPLTYEYRDIEWQQSLNIEKQNGYESFVSINGQWKINDIQFNGEGLLRARMPIYTHSAEEEYGEISNPNAHNEYLYENLDSSYWEGDVPQPTNKIENIFGYWTLSSSFELYYGAYFLSGYGYVYDDESIAYSDEYGVRPVITLGI